MNFNRGTGIGLVSPNVELNAKITEFVTVADEITATYWTRQNFTFSPPPTHRADFLSDKWVRIVNIEHTHDGGSRVSSVYAFIALVDNTTKALGVVKPGDIHKPATFKAPAKHARGNVFEANYRTCLNEHGPVYLRH